MAAIYERSTLQADLEQAAKTYEMLLNKVPTDPNICVKLGQVNIHTALKYHKILT
jgi:hypothetical protein